MSIRRFNDPRKEVRLEACRLAAQCMHGQCGPDRAIAGRIMSLAVFFETYIAEGASATEEKMRMLTHNVRGPRRKQWRLIAGGDMSGAA